MTGIVPLPSGTLACASCGTSVAGTRGPTVVATPMVPMGASGAQLVPGQVPVTLTLCETCEATYDRAERWVADHPAYAAAVGARLAVERVDAALAVAQVLGLPQVSDVDLAVVVDDLFAAGTAAQFSRPLTVRHGVCAAEPWSHVSEATRTALREAWARSLRARTLRLLPDAAKKCPSGGCLFCGLGSVAVPADQAGQPAHLWWREVTVTPPALGMAGPNLIKGHVCGFCSEAIDDVGSIGPTARNRALVAHLKRSGEPDRAARLREAMTDPYAQSLRSWASTGRPPSPAAWAHLSRALATI